MIHYVSDGDIPIVGSTVLALGDGDAWAPVAPAGPHDMAAVDAPTYEERGIVGAADLPWADAVALGPHGRTGAPTAADWQRTMAAVGRRASMVACLPACWVGETMSMTSGWVAVARETPQSEAEHALAMAGEPAACACTDCLGAGRAGAGWCSVDGLGETAWRAVGEECETLARDAAQARTAPQQEAEEQP